ncbi:MAG TPA: hypothetical protein VGR21_12865 [Cryptosporangiaceae bacterium]|nr:hypothetical protein [Cryptosporangiaceae bacterium]
MLFALGQPFALLGLLAAFVVSLVVRAFAAHVVLRRQVGRMPLLDPRRDFDIFGAVAAVFGGTGWGRRLDDVAGRPAPPGALLAGPLAVLVVSQLAFAGYRLAGADTLLLRAHPASTVLTGVPGEPLSQALASFAVGMLCFGLLALFPLPPLDGWGLLRRAVRRPGPGFQKAEHWLDGQNIGTVILLAGMILPLSDGRPLVLILLDLLTAPFFVVWS